MSRLEYKNTGMDGDERENAFDEKIGGITVYRALERKSCIDI